MTTTNVATKLTAAIEDWKLLLQGWAVDGFLSVTAQEAMLLGGESEALSDLLKRWSAGDSSSLPPVNLLDAREIGSAADAFAIHTSTIWLSTEWLSGANQTSIIAVLTEELGHHLAATLSAGETPRDEGKIFANILLRNELSEPVRDYQLSENDHSQLSLGNQTLAIEQSNTNVDVGALIEGLDALLSELQLYVMSTNVLGSNLPLFGDDLSTSTDPALNLFEGLREPIRGALTSLQAGGQVTDTQVADTMTQVLREQGVISTGDQVTILTSTTNESRFSVKIDKAYTTSIGLAGDFGLPALSLAATGNANLQLAYNFDFTFGIDESGFYYQTNSNGTEVVLALDATIPNLFVSGTLGSLGLSISDDSSNPTFVDGSFALNLQDTDGKVRTSEFTTLNIATTLSGEADINLDLDTGLQGGTSLPRLGTSLNIDWALGDGASPFVAFSDITIDLGSFLSDFAAPVIENVSVVLQPIADVLSFLTTPIDLKFVEFDLLDIIRLYDSSFDDSFIRSIGSVLDLTSTLLSSSSYEINLGSFDFGDLDLQSTTLDISSLNLDSLLGSSSGALSAREGILQNAESSVSDPQLIDLLQADSGSVGLDFPILTDATQVLKLFLGQDAELFSYRPPEFGFDINYSQSIPIVWPLGLNIEGSLGSRIALQLGFDSYGLTESDTVFFDGFYIDQSSRLSLYAEILGAIEANVGFASAGGGAFIRGGIGFGLNDDVRFSQIQELIDRPEDIFQASGVVEAGLSAYLKALGYKKRFDSPTVELIKWGSGEIPPSVLKGNSPDNSTLGQVNDNTFNLFIGNLASSREPTAIQSSRDESFEVVRQSVDGEEKVLIKFSSRDGTGDGSYNPLLSGYRDIVETSIIRVEGDGGDGDDIIDLRNAGTKIAGFLIGGLGNDQLVGGAEADTLHGGDGDDRLEGLAGQDSLFGGAGDDELQGGQGNDTLAGGVGQDLLNGNEGDDVLEGGEDDDVLIGGAGADQLNGGTGVDVASYITSNAGISVDLSTYQKTGDASGDSYIDIEGIEGTPYNDVLIGNSRSNQLFGGESNDDIQGMDGDDLLDPGWGDDVVDGGTGIDRLVVDYSSLSTSLVAWFQQNQGLDGLDGRYNKIYLANAYGIGEPFPLAEGLYIPDGSIEPSSGDQNFSISADGTTIAWIGQDIASEQRYYTVFVYRLDDVGSGGALTKYFFENSYVYFGRQALSSDGKKLVFSQLIPRPDGSGLSEAGTFLLDTSSGVSTKLSDTSLESPVISADGSTIAGGLYDPEAGYRLGILGVDGSQLHYITSSGPDIFGSPSALRYPSLSADGSIIAATTPNAQGNLYVGSTHATVLPQAPWESMAGYDPNDTEFLFFLSGLPTVSEDGSLVSFGEVVIGGLDTDKPQLLYVNETSSLGSSSISVDGDKFVASRYIGNAPFPNGRPDGLQVNVTSLSRPSSGNEGNYTKSLPLTLASDDLSNVYDYAYPLVSSNVRIGVRYSSFDPVSGSGEILTWGPARLSFSNIEAFDLTGTPYGDELYGGNYDDLLIGVSGTDTLAGGLGNDVYSLSSDVRLDLSTPRALSGGSIIHDLGGSNDQLLFDSAQSTTQQPFTLQLQRLAVGVAGLKRYGTSLLIDLNSDGVANPGEDLLIEDFFNPDLAAGLGVGLIEKVVNLSGADIVSFLGSDNAIPVATDDLAQGNINEYINLHVLENDTDLDDDSLRISNFDTLSAAGGRISLNDNATPEDQSDDYLLYLSPKGFSGADSFAYEVTDVFGGRSSATARVDIKAPASPSLDFKLTDGLGFPWRIFHSDLSNSFVFAGPPSFSGGYNTGLTPYETDPLYPETLPGISRADLRFASSSHSASSFLEANGREAVVQGLNGSVYHERKVYTPENESFVRLLESVTNVGPVPITYTVEIVVEANFVTGESVDLVKTSSGDSELAPGDDWLVLDNTKFWEEPPLVHVIAGRNAALPATASASLPSLVGPGLGEIRFSYDLTLQPGETKSVLHFGALDLTAADALIKAQKLANLELGALDWMNPEELARIVNFSVDGSDPPLSDDGDAVFSITGTPAVGERLFATEITPDPDGAPPAGYSYQWQSSSDGNSWSPISVANTSSYSLTAAEQGKQVRVLVSYIDGQGFQEEVQASGKIIETGAPPAPTLELAADTGLNPLDGITANGSVLVAGLETGASWQYSTDGGFRWIDGLGTSVRLTENGARSVIARQVNQSGTVSSPSAPLNFILDNNAGLILSDGFAQLIYVAYYGRPADPGGLRFWNDVLGSNEVSYAPRLGDLLTGSEAGVYDRIVNDFGNSPEANNLLAGLSKEQQVDQVYQFLFNRNAEVDSITGKNYWFDQLDQGNISLAQLAVEVALGAQAEDIVVFSNKIRSANSFTSAIDVPVESNAYGGETARLFGISYLSAFGETAAGNELGNSALDQFLSGSDAFTPPSLI